MSFRSQVVHSAYPAETKISMMLNLRAANQRFQGIAVEKVVRTGGGVFQVHIKHPYRPIVANMTGADVTRGRMLVTPSARIKDIQVDEIGPGGEFFTLICLVNTIVIPSPGADPVLRVAGADFNNDETCFVTISGMRRKVPGYPTFNPRAYVGAG